MWQFLSAVGVVVLVVGAVAWAFTDGAGRQTILVSGGLTMVVQGATFAIARSMRSANPMVGWGLGSLVRLGSLVLYALVVARLWHAPVTPALLSYAAMLFVSMVVEPVFLKR